jgi:hypothetical protein
MYIFSDRHLNALPNGIPVLNQFGSHDDKYPIDDIVIRKATTYVYTALVNRKFTFPEKTVSKWCSDIDVEYSVKTWQKINEKQFKCTIETKLRNFYFKLFHRILPCNEFLYRIGVIETDLCTFCEEAIETIYHYMCSCPLVVMFWQELLSWIKDTTSVCLELTPPVLMFAENVKDKFQCVEYILLSAKYFIYVCRIQKKAPVIDYFLDQLKNEIKIEYEIAQHKNMVHKHLQKWFFEM